MIPGPVVKAGEALTEPATDVVMQLPTEAIHSYEHNPRRTVNAEYDRLKASIRIDGLTQPLLVSQRPDSPEYRVCAGGNTRLAIIQDLLEETGDPRFATAPCLLRPWQGDAQVLLAHLKENELRGELRFVDKARAVADVRRFLEQELCASLSQTQLASALKERGFSLSQSLISQMQYAVERLLPLLPKALEGGLGRPQVERLRALDRAALTLWRESAVESDAEYEEAFVTLCKRYDAQDWDITPLRRALEAEIADRLERNLHAVSLELDALLGSRARTVEEAGEEAVARSRGAATTSPPQSATRPVADGRDAAAPQATPAEAEGARTSTNPAVKADVPSQSLNQLRTELCAIATRLAQRHGLADLVQPLPDGGMGFVLTDVPSRALVTQLDEQALAQISLIWWHLAACAELTVAPLDAVLPVLDERSVLCRALREQDAGLLFSSVWTLDPGHMGHGLWRALDDADWQDLLALMNAYRALHRQASAGGEPLWRSP